MQYFYISGEMILTLQGLFMRKYFKSKLVQSPANGVIGIQLQILTYTSNFWFH